MAEIVAPLHRKKESNFARTHGSGSKRPSARWSKVPRLIERQSQLTRIGRSGSGAVAPPIRRAARTLRLRVADEFSGAALDAGRCQRGARLAYLRGVGPAIDRLGEATVRQRGFGFRPRQYGLCARLDDHRSLSGGLSVGAFPHDQGGGQDAHAIGLTR